MIVIQVSKKKKFISLKYDIFWTDLFCNLTVSILYQYLISVVELSQTSVLVFRLKLTEIPRF